MKKKIICTLFALLFAIGMTGCASFLKDNEIDQAVVDKGPIKGTITVEYWYKESSASLEVKKTANFQFELYYEQAPNTVASFYDLAIHNWYNDTLVTSVSSQSTTGVPMGKQFFDDEKDDKGKYKEPRVVDYTTKVDKDAKYKVIGEFEKNGWEKNDKTVGVGSMYMTLASADDYNSAGAAFNVSLLEDSKAGKTGGMEKTNCVFGKILDTNGDFHDFTENFTGGYIVNSEEKTPKITGITFDSAFQGLKLKFNKA